ncbi:flagellar hook-length control protein FliK [Luteimonas sp. RD2P54]|uniref:Flagellar hook-length control protein FliK n=1 Tax=Luteimonas endophytica TaxID=3042023 RepID=A0ABT6J7Q1_9GAMM|nr:flagellar hook-length control protein FliK [Luteimonas endophytica]MDH5822769.1 flagellar hook-length control protein FliK [Luteimonas endophytica]
MNMPGLDPLAPAATGQTRGPGARQDGGGDTGERPFEKMIDRGQEQRAETPGGGREAHARRSETAGAQARAERADPGTGEPATGAAQARDGLPAEQEAAETAAGAAAFAAEAPAPWPPQGLAALGLITLAPAATPGDQGAGVDAAAAAAWSQLAAAGAGNGDARVAPAAAMPAPPGNPMPGALAAAVQTAAAVQAQAAAAAEPSAPLALEPLALASAGGDGDAPAPSFLVAAATPVQPARDSLAVAPAPPTPTPDLHGDDFAESVGTRLQWLADQKIGHAQIRITPHDLGPIEVRLRLDGDRVSADFSSAQAEVRQALEASLPRLREMLGAHGFQLAHADVGQQSRQDGASARQRADGTGAGNGGEDGAPQPPLPAALAARGLLDAYA